jgi:hypothetical protein
MVTCDNAGAFQQKQEIRNTRRHEKGAAALDGIMLEIP